MHAWSRLFTGLLLALVPAALFAAPELSLTGVTIRPGEAKPGDQITLSVGVTNSGASGISPVTGLPIAVAADTWPAGSTATLGVTFTHVATGYTFSFTGTGTLSAGLAGGGTAGTVDLNALVPVSFTEAGPYRVALVWVSHTGAAAGDWKGRAFATSTPAFSVVGKPDLQIVSLTYTANPALTGGAVVPMTLKFLNASSSNGVNNVPFVPVPGLTQFRIQVVLSANPVFGDADDFQLTTFDRSTKLDADSTEQVLTWQQVMPGNFAGSYYVLAKIDSLNAVAETVEEDLTRNGNNIWQDLAATRIAIQPTTFPTVYLASTTGPGGASPSGNARSDNPALSADGRYTVFASDAANLVPGDTNGVRDIFLFDSQTSLVRRLSLSQQGVQATAPSEHPTLSGNGRQAAFASDAANLVIGDVNGFTDIFAVDTLTGAIALQTLAADGTQANGSSFRPMLSHTGRWIAFESTATNLIAGGTAPGVSHVYLRDRDVSNSGVLDTPGNTATVLVDIAPGGAAGNAAATQAAVSADGQFVAFASRATNLVANPTAAGRQHVYVRQVPAGATMLVSVDPFGVEADADSRHPSISRNPGVPAGPAADGRWIAFTSDATNLVAADANGMADVFVADRVSGAVNRVSVSSAGVEAIDPTVTTVTGSRLGSLNPSVSATGRFVTFVSLANNLAPGDTLGRASPGGSGNGGLNVYVMDRDTDDNATYDEAGRIRTSIVSVNRFGFQAYDLTTAQTTAAADIFPVISADGRWVAFPFDADGPAGLVHGATNLLSPDANNARDVLLFDRRTNTLPSPATPPTVAITSPGAGGTVLVNTAVTLAASATTTTGVVRSVQFFVNGTSVGTSEAFPYTATWTPRAVGSYTLSALVTDSFGNLGVSANVPVTVNAAPSVSVTFPSATTPLTVGAAQTVTASAAATTPGATIASVQFLVDGQALGAPVTVAPYATPWTPVAAGTFSLTAVAVDSAGTRTTSPAVVVTVVAAGGGGGGGGGGPLPTVAVTAPAGGAALLVNTPVRVTAAATSPGGSIVQIQFLANGVDLGIPTSFPFGVTWTPSAPGTYALTAIATDSAGGKATSAPLMVAVGTGTAPAVVVASPAAGTTLAAGTLQTVVANVTAGSSLVASVQFLVNGIALGIDTTFPYNFSWTPAGIGPAVLTAVARDALGNEVPSAGVAVTVVPRSGSSPTVALTAPAAGASVPVGTATTLTAAAADPDGSVASVQFFANGVALAAPDTAFPFTFDFIPTSPGNYLLTAQAIDNGGNVAVSAPVAISVVAGSAPVVAVTGPADQALVPVNVPVVLTAAASSSSGTIAGVQFLLNGVAQGAPDTTFPYRYNWIPAALGTYLVQARATDNLGNITDSAPVQVTVAGSQAPVVAVTGPPDGSAFGVGTPLTLAADASDPDGTVTQVQFLVNGVPLGTPDSAAPYTAAWTPPAAGTYLITAQATDNTGNLALSAGITVTIGADAPPTVALTSPGAGLSFGLGNQIVIAANAADTDGAVTGVRFLANGRVIGSAAAAPYLFSWNPSAAGTYTLTASATDNAGNVTQSRPVTITVTAGAAPTVVLSGPPPSTPPVAGTAVPLVARASGGNGPIAQVQFFVNGAPLGSPDTTSPYGIEWTPAAPGTYRLLAVATDSAGVSASSEPLLVTAAGNAPPTVGLTAPVAGTSVNAGTPVTLAAVAADTDGRVVAVRFLANGIEVAAATAAPFTGSWAPTAAGTYARVAQARDDSGNLTTSAPVMISVLANRPPVVALTFPTAGASLRVGVKVSVTATATDPDGSVASVQFLANGTPLGPPDTAAPFAADFTPGSEGIHRLTAVAVDHSGAVATSTVVTVLAVAPGAEDRIFTGGYQGGTETGRFAAAVIRGRHAVLIGFSNNPAGGPVSYHPDLQVDAAGALHSGEVDGRFAVSGMLSDSGLSGTLDRGRLTFIGVASLGAPRPGPAPGLYVGSLTGRAGSQVVAIVAADASITWLVQDGAFRDAGAGTLAVTGAFNSAGAGGARLAGAIDPVTGFLRGTLSGGPGGAFTGAPATGPALSDGALRNLSTRGQVGAGGNILIAGFVVTGPEPKQVLVRAVGPSLAGFGVAGTLTDPVLEVYRGDTRLASNDNWGGLESVQRVAGQVGAFPLLPSSLDAALVLTLAPGAYTAQVSGVAGRTGVALVELYDADAAVPFPARKLVNVATRGVVGGGQGQLIAGFVVSGTVPKRFLIRGVGPALAALSPGLAALPDPWLQVVRTESRPAGVVDVLVRENDSWEVGNPPDLVTAATVAVGAFPLAPGGRDAALLLTLPPGTYSAQVGGPAGSTGVALVEVYEMP
ncbi:MAG: Ig-like domain-containing protein [Opitutaceae bacterium]